MFASFGPGHIGLGLSIEDGFAMAQRHGFGGYDLDIGPAMEFASRRGAEELVELARTHGLQLGCWDLPFIPYQDEEAWRRGVGELEPAAQLAASIGATRTAMWILPASDTLPFDENFALHVERFTPVAEILARHSVRIGLEFVGPATARRGRKHPFIYNLPGMLDLCHAVGPNVGLLLDSWHWYTSGGADDDLARLTNDQIVHVHVNDAPQGVERDEQVDSTRRLPGATGVIDIATFVAALRSAGYDGPVTAEPFDDAVKALPPEEAASQTAQALLGVLGA